MVMSSLLSVSNGIPFSNFSLLLSVYQMIAYPTSLFSQSHRHDKIARHAKQIYAVCTTAFPSKRRHGKRAGRSKRFTQSYQ
jgi:hypothetical protein